MQVETLPLEIRKLTTYQELVDVQKLEKLIWNEPPIPLHQSFTAIQNGGLLLGAYIHDRLVGFSYSFAGFKNEFPYLCSHILGIHPDYQEKGIGAQLKKAQKCEATKLGYTLMTWTFDPLESRNAYLNLSKLGAICRTYVKNCYGEMQDGLNAGLPSDRFKIEWWLTDLENQKRVFDFPMTQPLVAVEYTKKNLPRLKNIPINLESIVENGCVEPIYVPIPIHFQQLKKEDISLALDWRLKTREIFQFLFSKGYMAIALQRNQELNVYHYVFAKEPPNFKSRIF